MHVACYIGLLIRVENQIEYVTDPLRGCVISIHFCAVYYIDMWISIL